MTAVGDQQHTGRKRRGVEHLAHQAIGIQNRLAGGHAVASPLVDNDFMGERVRRHPNHFRHHNAVIEGARGVHQFPQTVVLGGQGAILQRPALKDHQPGPQGLVFFQQVFTWGDHAGKPFAETVRRVAQPEYWGQETGNAAAYRFKPVETGVRRDQYQGKHQHNQEPEAGHRPLHEDGLNGTAPLPR